jgi:hypothetical protein
MLRIAAALALLVALPRPAGADNQAYWLEGGEIVALGVVLLGADVALTAHDLTVDDTSTGVAIAEVILTVPQVVAFGAGAVLVPGRWRLACLVGLAWTGALLAHGIRELREPTYVEDAARIGLSFTF